MATLNKRNELVSACRHNKKFLLRDGPLDIWGGGCRNPPKEFEQAFNPKKKTCEKKTWKKISCKHPSYESKLRFLDPYLELLDSIKYEEYIECRDNPDDRPLLHYAKLPNLWRHRSFKN
jgi:hypothetical protein